MKKIVSIFVSLSLLLCNLISVNANDNTAKNNQKISYLSEPEARCFIGFIFNNYKEDDKKEKTDGIYELLTGQLSGYDEEVAIVQFVNLMETQITYSIGKWDENSEKTKELIIDYLKTKSNGDMTNDIVNSTLGDISKTFIEYFKDEYLINGHGLEDMEFENLEKGILMGKFIKDINNFPDKVNAYRNEMLTIMISTFFVTSTNRKEMYNYLYNYYNLLDIKYNYGQDAFDLVKSTNELYNEQLAIIKLIEPTLANWSFLDDNMLLWATDDRISLIQKWAELAYQLKNKVLNEAKSNQNDNAESPSDKDIQTNTHYNEIDTNDLQYTLTNEGAVINKYNGSLSYAKIPNEIEGYKVIKINDNAFSNNKLLKYILIPGCVKIIGSKAFQNCVNLQKVIISNGDIVIKEKAFSVYRNMIINSKVYEIDTGLGTTLCSSSNSNVEEYANNSGNKFESTDWDGKTKTEVYPVGDIYYINTPAELAWLTTKNRNINYFKDKIIDISGTFNMNNKDFTPIGASFCNESLLNSEMSKVKEINLNNAKINELKVCLFGISYVDSKNGGLFGSVLANTVKVKECIFSNTNIDQYNHYTENYVGTIFGSLQIEDGGSIEIDDNKFGGNVCARQVYTGGIIGRLILNNGNCNIKNYYSTMNVGGTVQYLDSMTAGGIIGKLINNGKVNISACNVEGNIESEAGLNTVSQCHPGEVGGLIGRVENNGIINIDKVNLDFSAHATCGSYDAAHIGTAIAYLERNTGNIEINNTRNVINKNKGTYNLLIGRGSMARDNVKISNSYFIINGNNSYLDGCSSYMNCYDNSYILDNGNVTCHVYDNDLDIAKEGKEKLLSSFRTNVEMKNVSNYKNWDFNNIWYMENDGYPHLMCLDNKELYTITAKAMDGGYISNEGTAKIKKGGRIEYTILPNDNKKVSRIVVDGIEQPIENTYIFENINENHTIVVYFEEKEYRKINYILNGGKLVDGTPTKHYLGSITTLVPPIKEGKTFMGWYNNSSFEGNSISEISYDDSEINLYAKWCSFVEIEYAFIGTYQEIVNTTKPFEYCEYVEEGKSLQEFRIKLNKQYCFTKNILEKISFSNNNSGLKVKIENDSELIFYGNIENNIYVKVGESGKIIKYTKPKIKNLGNKIGNTNSSMEYTDSLELENWRDCEENETFVSQGKYYVRYKENDRVLASDLVEIIIKKTVTGIKVTPPSKVGYVEGQGLQLTGGSIEITYNDGTKENKDLTEEMISGYDKSKVGEQEIKVSYGNQETTFKVSVIKKTVTGIKVTPPSKVGYVEGQGLQLTGGSIEITYNDGTKENKDLTEEMISGYDKSKVGEQEIKVSYGNQETTFKVSVIKKTVTGIKVTPPSKVGYVEGQGLQLTGGSIEITYNDGTKENKDLTEEMISGYDKSKVGEQEIKVSYGNQETTFKVSVIKKTVTGIKVTPPSKVGYVEGQGLQLTGGSIEITYNDGTKENKDLTEEMISGYDKSKVGEQEIKVSYGNQETTFKVSVIKKTVTGIKVTPPSKVGYVEGQGLQLTGGSIEITYNDGTKENKDLTEEMISGYDKSKVGEQEIKVSYGNQETTFKVSVIKKTVTGIKVTPPSKVGYVEGQGLQLTGGSIEITYNDGTKENKDLTEEMISGYDKSKVGEQEIKVSYGNQETTFKVSVIKKTVTGINDKNEIVNTDFIKTGDGINFIENIFFNFISLVGFSILFIFERRKRI